MASLEKRGDVYRAKYRYGGRQFSCSLKTGDYNEASSLRGRLEENLRLLERGRLDIPTGADIGLFLISDGKVTGKPVLKAPLSLSEFFRRYHDRKMEGKEANTRYTEKIHTAHLERLINSRIDVRAIRTETLQGYVDARAMEKNRRGHAISHVTIQKEVGTFASVWNKFGVPQELVTGSAPTKGLIYGKEKAKPPFQSWEQIERTIKRGGLTSEGKRDLWDRLFLSLGQVQEVLDHAKATARAPFVHPMFVFAARTGARRSEILRSEVEDFDFEAGIVRIREKKKDKSKEMTFRHVPLSPLLASVMKEWFARHPGGQFTLCEKPNVALSPQTASHHFCWAVEDSKWQVLKGWHIFRHSFASNCAAKGVDQRVISEWLGHMTPQMERRYRHLFPEQQRKALELVFNEG
jgi:integrase